MTTAALGQDVLFDNFGLFDNFSPTGNRLVMFNGNLNTPGEPAGWTVTEGPEGMSAVGGALHWPTRLPSSGLATD